MPGRGLLDASCLLRQLQGEPSSAQLLPTQHRAFSSMLSYKYGSAGGPKDDEKMKYQ